MAPLSPALWTEFSLDDALVDAFVGVAFFKALRGSFSGVLPSDLLRPGAFARRSIPATGTDYASSSAKLHLKV